MAIQRKPKTPDAATDRLYKAVQNYVEKQGGKLLVIGGVTIQEWPTDNAHVFHVAIKCLGRKPDFAMPTKRTPHRRRNGQ